MGKFEDLIYVAACDDACMEIVEECMIGISENVCMISSLVAGTDIADIDNSDEIYDRCTALWNFVYDLNELAERLDMEYPFQGNFTDMDEILSFCHDEICNFFMNGCGQL